MPDPELLIRIQQNIKEQINKKLKSKFKPVNSRLCILYDLSLKLTIFNNSKYLYEMFKLLLVPLTLRLYITNKQSINHNSVDCTVVLVVLDYLLGVHKGTERRLTAMEAHSIVNTLRFYYPAMFAAAPGSFTFVIQVL